MAINAAYVTLLTRDSYLPGTLVLHRSLRSVKSRYPLVVMYTDRLSDGALDLLRNLDIKSIQTEGINPASGDSEMMKQEQRFEDTWTKLRCFGLTEYDRIVFLDSDMLVRKNMDDLFEMSLSNDTIAAVHVCACNPRKLAHYPVDWVPANCAHTQVVIPSGLPPMFSNASPRPHGQLNSGTLVVNPSKSLSEAILEFLFSQTDLSKFPFPDQDLLTAFFFGRWMPLPWYYNALRPLRNIHSNLWDDDVVRCVHYIFGNKPWTERVPEGRHDELQFDTVNRWWWSSFVEVETSLKDRDPEGWNLIDSLVAPPLQY